MPRKIYLVPILGLLVLVAGCREEEQERPLLYEKGTYKGPEDTPLPAGQSDALRQRAIEAYGQ